MRIKTILPIIILSVLISGCGSKVNVQTPVEDNLQSNINISQKNNDEVKSKNIVEPSFSKKVFYGQWIIKKVVASSKVSTYSSEDINGIIGKQMTFSKEQSSSFGEDISYMNNNINNPTYNESVVIKDDFESGNYVSFSSIGLKMDSVTEIAVVDSNNNHVCLFYIKDDNTLILYGGGIYFELNRYDSTSSNQKHGKANGYIYKNEKLGFGFIVPQSWNGNYTIEETDDGVYVYFKPKRPVLEYKAGFLFSILKSSAVDDEHTFDTVGEPRIFEAKGITYITGGPTDVSFPTDHEEFDSFCKMSSEVSSVVNTIKS